MINKIVQPASVFSLPMGNYFSVQSEYYARNRPTYPEELFVFLSGLCSSHELAWDCATGNGQAAISLSKYFKKVVATDLSAEQISRAFHRENIFYKVEPSEHSSLENESADLVTVATAIHWFNLPAFYKEVHRVLKPHGVFAAWGYAGCTVNYAIDKMLDEFAFDILKDYWRPETKLNWRDKYETLNFPYPLTAAPSFAATAQYNLNDILNYLNSWSSVQKYKDDNKTNPINSILPRLEKLWGAPEEVKPVSWDLFLKCGRKEGV
jgi:ubiquinone/menaquinone biosynthesis C-methylase UbiE